MMVEEEKKKYRVQKCGVQAADPSKDWV